MSLNKYLKLAFYISVPFDHTTGIYQSLIKPKQFLAKAVCSTGLIKTSTMNMCFSKKSCSPNNLCCTEMKLIFCILRNLLPLNIFITKGKQKELLEHSDFKKAYYNKKFPYYFSLWVKHLCTDQCTCELKVCNPLQSLNI